MARRPDEIVQVNLRIPERLRQTLVDEAYKANRTLNEEMLVRIMQTFHRQKADQVLEKAEALNEHTRRIHLQTARMLGVPDEIALVAEPMTRAQRLQQIQKKRTKVEKITTTRRRRD